MFIRGRKDPQVWLSKRSTNWQSVGCQFWTMPKIAAWIYKDRIRMFHVKDAEFNPTGRQGVYGGFQSWVDRAGRFRSLGDGQVDFAAIFAKMAANDFAGWAVVEWECALKHPEDGAREGAQFVKDHIIRVTDRAFDDFADGGADAALNAKPGASPRTPGIFQAR